MREIQKSELLQVLAPCGWFKLYAYARDGADFSRAVSQGILVLESGEVVSLEDIKEDTVKRNEQRLEENKLNDQGKKEYRFFSVFSSCTSEYEKALDMLPKQISPKTLPSIQKKAWDHLTMVENKIARVKKEFPNREVFQNDLVEKNRRIDDELISGLKSYHKLEVDKWLNWFKEFKGLKGKKLEEAINVYKKEHPKAKLSYSNFKKKLALYEENGVTAVVPGWGLREGASKIPDELYEKYKGYYLTKAQRTEADCWREVRGFAYDQGYNMEDFPVVQTFSRRLGEELDEEWIDRARLSEDAWRSKYKKFVPSDPDSLKAGEWWVGDHRKSDVLCIDPKTGKTFRPWITAWKDRKSHLWMNVYPHKEEPNRNHILQSIYWGIKDHQDSPEKLLVDNGMDYRSYAVSGYKGPRRGKKKGWFNKEEERKQMKSRTFYLGLEIEFAKPKNPQSKNIEPAFKEFINLEKTMPGYIGKDTQNRPDDVEEARKKGELLTLEEFTEQYLEYVELLNYRKKDTKQHQGLSPIALYNKERTEKVVPREDALKELLLNTSKLRTIGKLGVTVHIGTLKASYWHDEMIGKKGRKVFVGVDPRDPDTAWIHHKNETAWLQAKRVKAQPVEAKTDQEMEDFHANMETLALEDKMFREFKKSLPKTTPEEHIKHMWANHQADIEQQKKAGTYKEFKPTGITRIKEVPADKTVRDKERIKQEEQEREQRANERPPIQYEETPKPKKIITPNDDDWYKKVEEN
jgi:hypothetical protein